MKYAQNAIKIRVNRLANSTDPLRDGSEKAEAFRRADQASQRPRRAATALDQKQRHITVAYKPTPKKTPNAAVSRCKGHTRAQRQRDIKKIFAVARLTSSPQNRARPTNGSDRGKHDLTLLVRVKHLQVFHYLMDNLPKSHGTEGR